MYVLLGDMLIPDIKDQIHGFYGNFSCSRNGAFVVDSNIFSLCTCVTEAVLLYNEVLCYFLKSNSILVCVISVDFTCI